MVFQQRQKPFKSVRHNLSIARKLSHIITSRRQISAANRGAHTLVNPVMHDLDPAVLPRDVISDFACQVG